MNCGPNAPNTVEKACPTSAEPSTPVRAAPVSRSTRPLVSTTRAVRVQTTMVSANTSNMPHIPCWTGSSTLAAQCTSTDAPSPASLEKAPRLNPQLMARAMP